MQAVTTLRPGLLVSLKTSLVGNVVYDKETINGEYKTEEGALKSKWQTEKTVIDPDEHAAAVKVRSKASSLIRSVCARSAFGLLCPADKAKELEQAIAAAREEIGNFNAAASLSRVYVYVITGRIEPNDAEAVRAINSEVRDLLADMETGVKNIDPIAIREAASRAKNLGSMLSPDAAARIQIAIDAVRSTARKIVQAGEQTAIAADDVAFRRINEARTAFLDLDDAKEIGETVAESRAVDFDPAPLPQTGVATVVAEDWVG